MINLPKGIRKQEPTHCNLCGDKLTKKNRYVYVGNLSLRCKKCLSEMSKKHNARRKERLKGSKLW